jgi:hypothetical protein
MSEAYHADPTGGGSGTRGAAVARAAADWLSLAAAPTFAVMALMTATDGQPQWLCAAAHLGSPLSGMVLMYLLMSAFHTPPWLRLIAKKERAAPLRRASRKNPESARGIAPSRLDRLMSALMERFIRFG